MNTAELNTATATQVPETRSSDLKLEVVILPVSDAERTKQFFASLGWREDADCVFTEDFRVLQFSSPAGLATRLPGRRRPGVDLEPAAGRRGHRGGARRI